MRSRPPDHYYEVTVYVPTPDQEEPLAFISATEMPPEAAQQWHEWGDMTRLERWIYDEWRPLIEEQRQAGAHELHFVVYHLSDWDDEEEDYQTAEEDSFVAPLKKRPFTLETCLYEP